TWDSYAKNLISWFLLSDLDIKEKLVELKKGRGRSKGSLKIVDKTANIPRSSLQEILQQLPILSNSTTLIGSKYIRDLSLLDIIGVDSELTELGKELIACDEVKQRLILKNAAMKLPKMVILHKHMNPE